MEELHLCQGPFRNFNPDGTVHGLLLSINLGSYKHQEDLSEVIYENINDYDDVIRSIPNP